MSKDKRNLRRAVKKEAEALSEAYREEADQSIFRHIKALPEYQKANTIFCYVGVGHEIDTMPVLRDILQSGKTLGVPRCVSKGVMEVFQIETLQELSAGAFGIPEPKTSCRPICPEEIELALIPCLCCTKSGRRLGYGGGYYDRYLEKGNFTKAVLCREKLMKETIPTERHDIKMDLVISEKGVFGRNSGFLPG